MPDESVDKHAVEWICHTATSEARYYTAKANRATCEAAIQELDSTAAKASKAGKEVPAFTTLRKMLATRLRKLAKQEKGGK